MSKGMRMVKPTDVRMGPRWFGILSGLVCIVIVMVISCSDNKSGSTSGHVFSFGEIEWPKKYQQTAGGSFSFTVPITLGTGETVNCWYALYYMQNGSLQLDTGYQWIAYSGSYTFSADYHVPPEGVYKLYVALETSTPELFHLGNAEESKVYNFYVGSSNYYLDIDVEYIYQEGLDILHSYNQPGSGKDDFGTVTEPYGSSRVVFTHAYCPKEHPPRSSVQYALNYIKRYKQAYASFWDNDTTRPVFPYVLCAIDYFEDPQSGQRLTDVVGDARREYRVAMVAAGQIEQSFSTGWKDLKLWSACHELSHLVGTGLTDYCTHSNDHTTNTSQHVCLMTHIATGDPGNVPWYWCPGNQGFKLFDANYDFCDLCKERLRNLDFLFPGGIPKRSAQSVMYIHSEEK
jgi:hypothetical protein